MSGNEGDNMSEIIQDSGEIKIEFDPNENTAGKLFIGGLSWQTTEDGLRYYFEKFGELTDVALMTDKRTMQPRGFGFVSFKDPAALDVVLGQTHNIDGRVVDVKRAVPRDKAPAPSRQESRKIFVGGLAPEVGDKEFSEYFGKFGPLQDSIVMYDRKTNRSRGFGFATYENEEDVRTVLRQEHEIMGKWVELKRAEPRETNRPMDMTMTLGGRAALYSAGRGGGGVGVGGRGGGGGGGPVGGGPGAGGPGGVRYDEYGGYGGYMGGMSMNTGARGAGSGAAFGYRGAPYGGDAYGGRGVPQGGPYGGYSYGPAGMGGYYGGGYSGYSAGPYGASGTMGKGMEGPSYDMAADYSRAGTAGYASVPPSNGMRSTAGMEGTSQSTMGMGVYGNMGGYGGYGTPAMYQQQQQQQQQHPHQQSPPPGAGLSAGPGGRMVSESGYAEAYAAAAAAGVNGGGGPPGVGNYGGGRPQSSSTTQARVDRSYRPY